jgi:GntR family transcriptional regulator
MIFTIDLNNPKPTYQQIVDQVRKAIAIQALKPGDQLPTIREAAIQARVNRNTISRAYLEMEHLGLLRTRQGSGCFVSENGVEMVQEEKMRILQSKVDELLLEAQHYRVSADELIQVIKERSLAVEKETSHE